MKPKNLSLQQDQMPFYVEKLDAGHGILNNFWRDATSKRPQNISIVRKKKTEKKNALKNQDKED